MTFTNKATKEMKERILSELEKLAAGETDQGMGKRLPEALEISAETLQQRAKAALVDILHNYSHFSVSTIDSFFQKIVRNFARALLAGEGDQRQEVVGQYQASLELPGNSVKGKLVFQQNCPVCHQMGSAKGTNFGPDLTTVRNRRPASIMSDIIDPNLSIADGFDLWTVRLKNGTSVQGVISEETATALSLRNAGGQETTIARQDIESLEALGMSAMPEGLEKQISKQEMADLLAFVREVK